MSHSSRAICAARTRRRRSGWTPSRGAGAARKRRLALEILENRLLLTLTPVDLTEPQGDILQDGLGALAAWADTLDDHELVAQNLPAAGAAIGLALDFGAAIQTALVAPLESYFAVDDTPTSDELVAAIQGWSATYGNLQITVDPANVQGGLDSSPAGDSLVFELVFQASRTVTSRVSLGPRGDELGLAFDAATTAPLTVSTAFDFRFGMDTAAGVEPEDAFFVAVNALEMTAEVASTSPLGSIVVGFYDAEVTAGSLALDATLDIDVAAPGDTPGDAVTWRELKDTELSDLVTLTPSGTSSGNLTLAADPFAGFTPGSSLTVSFNTTNPFQPPELTFSPDFDELLNFTHVSSYSFLGVLNQVGSWLDQARHTPVLDTRLPLVRDTRIGDVLAMGDSISSLDTGLVGSLLDQDQQPTFSSIQGLTQELTAVLGLSEAELNAAYDAVSNEMTFHLMLDHAFVDQTLPFGLDVDLSPVGSLATSATVGLAAGMALEFVFGIDLTAPQAVLKAKAAGPSDGKLSSDAEFTLEVGGGDPVTVNVAQVDTNDNGSLADLADDINTALGAAGLGPAVTAGVDGDRLTLTTSDLPSQAILRLRAGENDPMLDEVHFANGQIATDSVTHHTFIEQATVDVSAEITATDIDATAELGFLGISVVDGSGSADVSVGLGLKAPGAANPGGRVYLSELFAGLGSRIGDVVSGPAVSGSVNATLPLQVTPNILGASHPADPELVLSWPDITDGNTLSVSLNDADLLLDFTNLDSATVIAALSAVASYLADAEGSSFLAQKIPGLNRSLGEIAGYAEQFLAFVTDFQNDPAGVLQELEAKIEAAFGLDDDALDSSLAENNTVLRLDMTLEETIGKALAIDLDLDGLGGGDFGNLIDFRGSGQLSAEVGVLFQLDLGIDLTNRAQPRPFLYETSQLGFTAQLGGQDIDFTTALGPMGVWIKDGSLLIDGDGNPATTGDTVLLGLTLDDGVPASDRIYLDDLSLDDAHLGLSGQVHATLPLFAPTENSYLGDITLTVADLGDIEGTTTLVTPDLEERFGEFDLINNLSGAIDGIDFVLGIIQDVVSSQVLSHAFPMIGDGLADAAGFIQDIRTDVIQKLRDRFGESLNSTAGVIQLALFETLGPEGLDFLLDGDEDGDVDLDDIWVEFSDTDLDGSNDDQVDVAMILGKEATIVDTPIDFDLGIPALGLEVDGNVQLALGFAWTLAFGLSREDGFYLNTSAPAEFALTLEARTPDLQAEGDLLFFQLDVTDEDADGNPLTVDEDVDQDGVYPSVFAATIAVDIKDPINSAEEKLTFADLTSGSFSLDQLIEPSIQGGLALNLNLLLSYEGDARFPSLGADLAVAWAFAAGDDGLSGGAPSVAFNNVVLNAGEFISDFADSLLRDVQQITDPLQPIVDFVTEPLPIAEEFGIDITVLDLVEALGYGDVASFVAAVGEVITLINSVPILDDNLYIPLGSFDLGDTDPLQKADLSDVEPNVAQQVDAVGEMKSLAAGGAGQFYTDMTEDEDISISFPILENPLNAFKLLLGQDVDLFLLDLPPLEVGLPFPILKIGPIIPPIPIFVALNGYIGASVDLKFGYDTHGLRTFLETKDPLDVFSGFFISDREKANGTGKDVPEGTLTGVLNVGVELNVAVASAGVSGGVAINLYADFDDPNGDGKIHVDEFLGNLELGLLSTFDVYGEVKAKLDAYVELLWGVARYEYTLAEFTIADFELTDSDIYVDRFAGGGGGGGAGGEGVRLPAAEAGSCGTVRTLGIAPGLHVDGLSLESSGDTDCYEFELLSADSVDVDVRHSYARGDIDLEVYDAFGNLLGAAHTDHDREIVSLADVPAGKYYAKVSGQRNNYMFAVEPGETSLTRVIYVNPEGKEDRSDSYYTTLPGDDRWNGLLYRRPKATLQSVLDTYELGPHDLVVLDTGSHAGSVTITAADQGATYVGSIGGSEITGIQLDDSDNNVFEAIVFAGPGTGLTIGAGSEGNVVRRNTFAGVEVGVQIDSGLHNLVEQNHFLPQIPDDGIDSDVGVSLASGATATVRDNDIAGRVTGVYSDSRVAWVYGNEIHGNAVGMSSRRGILGPDNPAPVGSAGGLPMNEIYDNDIGILVPPDATGVWVRFNDVYNNREAGIEQRGDASVIVGNDVHHNSVGIRGLQLIGPDQWGSELHNLVHDNGIGILAEAGTEVRYNRVFSNVTGIQIADDAFVHHNQIYRNTSHGVLVDGARNVRLINNTIFAPAGNGVHLENFADEVTIQNNILYAESGYALYVATDSQFGYTSDYNNLYATGGGRVAFQGKDFYDVYDWQVETESDLHSLGRTDPAPALDNPQFVALGADDYRLQADSTSIDAGHPGADFSFEPSPNGGRVNPGAFGNTPLAAASASSWLRITTPNFYTDLVPSRTYEIRWDTYNVPGTDTIDIALLSSDGTTLADVASTVVSAGSVTWSPGQFVSGDPDLRYRIELSTSGATSLTARSREPFSVPNVVPSQSQTFYVNDESQADDEYTTAVGDNRNTGTTDAEPKEVIRPLVLSYAFGAGDVVRVDTGNYVHAVNLNLSGSFQPSDPRMNTVERTQITGPTDPNRTAQIDRANPHPVAKTIDIIGSPQMALKNLTLIGAYTGLHVRDGSDDFLGESLTIATHTADGLDIEGHSDGATLDDLTVHDNGQHGIFVESLLTRITDSDVYDNGAIGIALRNVGAAIVETSRVHGNLTGLDVINPGTQQAVIGHSVLNQNRGNLVYENDEDGIYASGNVLVAGNTVAENGGIGIYLNDGADALRNVVRQHTSGIWALGSESDILENRSYANDDTGIAASFASRIERNVTYTNGEHGIYTDWFSGVIDHNLVYDTGLHSIVVEGPGAGAALINNTVYEPCVFNEFEPPPGETVIEIPWEWQVMMERFPGPGGFGGVFLVTLSGTAQMRFGAPVGQTTGGTFDLGPGGDSHARTAEPVPPGEPWKIPTELVALDLKSAFVPGLGEVSAMLRPSLPSQGSMTVEAVAMGMEELVLVGSTSLALYIDFMLPNEEQLLVSTQPMLVGMEFGPTAGLGLYDALRMAVPLSYTADSFPVTLLSPLVPEDPWGRWWMEGGIEGPLPQDGGQYCASAGIYVLNQSEYVRMRNNAAFVEGGEDVALHGIAHVVIVEADCSTGWDSEFNLLTTRYGAIGKWAGASQWTLTDWQNASRDDDLSIDSDPDTVWVDPDDDDDQLGFARAGASDGRDDNLHLKSREGHVLTGALAPVEQIAAVFPALPAMQTAVWGADPRDISPAIDWGDPSYDYTLELAENGQIINLGTYGNTDQASLSEPYYIHLVYPLGREELVAGRQYVIQWRSQLPPPAGVNLALELRHGNKDGMLQLTIDGNAPDTGSYLWTVPSAGIPRASDFVIVVRWPGDLADPNDDIVGEPRRQLTVDADGTAPDDTVPPTVWDVTPRVVHYGRSTNDDTISQLTVEFSENLDATAAGSAASYELLEAGSDGLFDTADDTAVAVTPTYAAGATDSDASHVDLALGAALLPGSYRLTIAAAAILDKAGVQLDGNDDGAAGGDYVRSFTVDRTAPTVQINSVSPNLQNGGLPSVTILFSEAVQGFGLADLRLTRDGGSNLLTGGQTLSSDDLITWTLGGLDEVTSSEGSYALELVQAESAIVDLAGNPLAAGDAGGWAADTTRPTVQLVSVTPDPRNTSVAEIAFVFSELVVNFDWTDLVLQRQGGANLLTAANAVTSPDGVTWMLTGLAALTAAEGQYALTLVADDSDIADPAGNALLGDVLEVWQLDVSPPQASIVAVTPDPRHTALDTISIEFSEPIMGLEIADLRLVLDGGANLLTGVETLSTLNNMSWVLSGLSGVTALSGSYLFTLVAAGSGIGDMAGNLLAADASGAWTVDLTPPTAAIVPVDPDPRTQSVDRVTIVFTEPVFGFDLSDLTLTRNGGGNLLADATRSLSTADGLTWTLDNLQLLTSASGDYVLQLAAAGAGIVDSAGNPLAGDAGDAWHQDLQSPSVDRIETTAHPQSGQVTAIEIVFTEPVIGFDLADLRLFRDNQPVALAGTAGLSSADQTTWTLDNLGGLTYSSGQYGLELRAFASAISDLSGNPLPGGGTQAWEMDSVWHNHSDPFDVNDRDGVTALDVLIIINYINAHPNDSSLPQPPALPPPYYDVDNDGQVTPSDVLAVVNYINSHPFAAGEGEASRNSIPPLVLVLPREPKPFDLGALIEPDTARPPARSLQASLSSDLGDDRGVNGQKHAQREPIWPAVEPARVDSPDDLSKAYEPVLPRLWDAESLIALDIALAEWDSRWSQWRPPTLANGPSTSPTRGLSI